MTGAVTRALILPAILLLTACADNSPPAGFLRPAGNWADAIVSVDITNLPLGSLGDRSAFQGMKIVLVGVDPEYRIALQATAVTRRQALWQLANQYGLSMTATTNGLVITNRELRRENKPLN